MRGTVLSDEQDWKSIHQRGNSTSRSDRESGEPEGLLGEECGELGPDFEEPQMPG